MPTAPLSETHVHVRSLRDTHFATDVSRKERTYTSRRRWFRRRAWVRESHDFVQPAHRCAVARVSEGLKFFIPGTAEQGVKGLKQILAAESRHRYCLLDPILRDHDVTVDPRCGVKDAQRRSV